MCCFQYVDAVKSTLKLGEKKTHSCTDENPPVGTECPLYLLSKKVNRKGDAQRKAQTVSEIFFPPVIRMYEEAGEARSLFPSVLFLIYNFWALWDWLCSTIDLHKAICALYHRSEWLFSIRAAAHDCFQWGRLKRNKERGENRGRNFCVAGLIV